MRKTKELENRIEKLESKVDKLSEMLGIKCWDVGFCIWESEADSMTPILRDGYVPNEDVLRALIDKLGFRIERTEAKDAGFVLEKKEEESVFGRYYNSLGASLPVNIHRFKNLNIEKMNNEKEQNVKKLSNILTEVRDVLRVISKYANEKVDEKEEEKTKTSSKKK